MKYRPPFARRQAGSTAARHSEGRDAWIRWNPQQRAEHLKQVLNMSRFLIWPSVRCARLASHLPGLCARRVGGDFERRYGVRPWLLPEQQAIRFRLDSLLVQKSETQRSSGQEPQTRELQLPIWCCRQTMIHFSHCEPGKDLSGRVRNSVDHLHLSPYESSFLP